MPKLDQQQRKHVISRLDAFMEGVKSVLKEKHTSKATEPTGKQKERLLSQNRAYGLKIKYNANLKDTLDEAIDWQELMDDMDGVLDQTSYAKELSKYSSQVGKLKDRAMLSTSDTDIPKLMEDIQRLCDQDVN